MSAGKSGIFALDRNIVLVVDDDMGVLKGVQRLLRAHAYEPILFSSAEAFKHHTDFDGGLCHSRRQPERRIGYRAEAGSQSRRGFRASHLHDRKRGPRRSRGCTGLRVHRVSDKALFRAVAH